MKRKKRQVFDSGWPSEVRRAFTRARAQANRRNAPWEMTIDEWFDIWESSGLWEKRGRVAGTYFMRRLDDQDAWYPQNVEIAKNVKSWR